MQAIFRVGLDEELEIAVSDLAAPRKFRESDPSTGELFVAACEATRQVRADADHVPSDVLDKVARGWAQKNRNAFEMLLEVLVRPDDIAETRITAALEKLVHELAKRSTKAEAVGFAESSKPIWQAVSPSGDPDNRRCHQQPSRQQPRVRGAPMAASSPRPIYCNHSPREPRSFTFPGGRPVLFASHRDPLQ